MKFVNEIPESEMEKHWKLDHIGILPDEDKQIPTPIEIDALEQHKEIANLFNGKRIENENKSCKLDTYWKAEKEILQVGGRFNHTAMPSHTIYSDNAKTPSCKISQRIFGTKKKQKSIEENLNQINWKFFTERAPWHERFYERMVKTPLKKILLYLL